MTVMTRVPLTPKEGEAIMWGLGQITNYPDRGVLSETDPLGILLSEGFSREAIMETGNALYEVAYGDWLTDAITPLEKAILRVCVENTTWLSAYEQDMPSRLPEAKAALRSLATKFEAIDIHVNHIPND